MTEQNLNEETNPFDAEGSEQAPKALRDAYNRQKQENDELRQRVAAFEQAQRESAVKQFVKEKELPEKVIGLIGDSNPEEWYAEYGDVFSVTEDKPNESKVPPEQVEQIKQVTEIQPGVYTPNAGEELDSKLDEIYSADISEKERHARLREIGAM